MRRIAAFILVTSAILLLASPVLWPWIQISLMEQTLTNVFAGMLLPMFSIAGVWLSTNPSPKTRRIGFALGLLSQPAWFYLAFTAFNFGLFINSVFFTLLWTHRIMFVNVGMDDGDKWRALLSSARLRPLGNSGLSPEHSNYGENAHMGLEIWTHYNYDPEKLAKEKAMCIDWLERYVAVAAKQPIPGEALNRRATLSARPEQESAT